MGESGNKNKKWTFKRVLSWFAGLSVGTSLLLVLLSLLFIAIFVRTEFFQTRLRDQVVQAVEKVLDAQLSYGEAKVEVFRLYPRISFEDVVLEEPQTQVHVQIERVSISISLFYSLPLLAFKKIHISEAEVSGLSYTLSDTQVIRAWLDRLRPKTSVAIPSQFQTVIGQILFSNFDLKLRLKRNDIFGRDLNADLRLPEFELSFFGDEIELDGRLDIASLAFSSVELENLSLEINGASYSEDLAILEEVALRHKDDFLVVQGEISNLQDPEFALRVETAVHFENYGLPFELHGTLEGDLNLEGPLKSLKGDGDLLLNAVRYKELAIDQLKSEFTLNYPQVRLDSFLANVGAGSASLGGNINLKRGDLTQLKSQFQNLPLGNILGLVNEDFHAWKGQVSGEASITADLFEFPSFDIQIESLRSKKFEIRDPDDEVVILEVEDTLSVGNLQVDKAGGRMNFIVDAMTSRSEMTAHWDSSQYVMDWNSAFRPGKWGRLFSMDVDANGSLRGRLAGPLDDLVLSVTPQFSNFRLNEFQFPGLSGELRLQDRRLFGAPLRSEGMELNGGLYFRKNAGTDFSDLSATFSKIDLPWVWSLLPTDDPRLDFVKGKLSGSGVLNGPLLAPVGQGNILIQDLAYAEDQTRGRLSKFNWNWKGKSLEIRDFYLETSRDGGGVRGSLDLHRTEIVGFELNGTKVKVGDWALFFGRGLQVQSLSDFKASFNKENSSLNAQLQLYETIVGSVVQERSSFSLTSDRNQLNVGGQLFRDAVRFQFSGGRDAQMRGNIDINKLNVIPLVKQLQGSGLEFLLRGSGSCEFIYPASFGNTVPYRKLMSLPDVSNCELKFSESNVTRASSSLHRFRAFQVSVAKKATSELSFKIPSVEVLTGSDRLKLWADYNSKDDYQVTLNGATSLESFSYFLPFLSRSEGRLAVDGVFKPSGFTGSVDLNGGMLLFQDSPFILRNVQASLKSSNSVIDLKSLSGEARDGNLSASGRVQLRDGFEVESALLVVQLNGPLIEPQSGLRFRTSGPLSLRIDKDSAQVSGQISVYDGNFRRRINLRSDLLRIFQPKEEKYQFVEKKEGFVDTWKLDVALKTTEPFVVRNNIADGAVDFDLYMGGTVARPQVSGNITLLRGQFNYNNRNFDLKAGSIQFSDTQSNIPRYDIRAETEIGEYRVFVTFQGDANQQKIVYSSDPPLTEKEILALVSYGTPPEAGENLAQADPTESAALTGISFVTGQLQDTIEGALSGDLGIQRFQIYPAFYYETGKTELQLTVGTDLIRNKLELNYSNFLTAPGGHEVQLGFRVNRNISLVGSWRDLQSSEGQNISGDFGGDVIFRFEFE